MRKRLHTARHVARIAQILQTALAIDRGCRLLFATAKQTTAAVGTRAAVRRIGAIARSVAVALVIAAVLTVAPVSDMTVATVRSATDALDGAAELK